MRFCAFALTFAAASAFVPTVHQFAAPRSAMAATVANGDIGISNAPQDTTVAAVPNVAQRWRKSTKQVATLGPASSTVEMIETLFLAGVDVFRLNFSHVSHAPRIQLFRPDGVSRILFSSTG